MGPLKGVTVVEIASIGPGPFCAMMLSDMGAEVIRIDRPGAREQDTKHEVLNRGRRSITVDLKCGQGVEVVLRLVERADALIEGFRPGVMERLGLGPDVCLARNRRLVYGRVTGWGQTGPLSQTAGHDINYIALSGVLHAIGRRGEKPVPPLNLVGDFGGGGMLLAFGLVCGILESRLSGHGQVIDATMIDGAALQMAMIYGWHAAGRWSNQRGSNLLDGGAPFYDVYECADGKYVAIGALEPKFYTLLLELTGVRDPALAAQMDEAHWPELRNKFETLFRTRTRDQWCAIMEGTDACFAPVLDLEEAPRHAHNVMRETFVEVNGVKQPAPAPRFSRTAPETQRTAPAVGEHTDLVLSDFGFSSDEIARLRDSGAI